MWIDGEDVVFDLEEGLESEVGESHRSGAPGAKSRLRRLATKKRVGVKISVFRLISED